MSLWIRYDPERAVWEVSPNESENYFADLLENHPREVTFSRWLDFDSFTDARVIGTLHQPEGIRRRRVRLYTEGELTKFLRRGGTRDDAWGPTQAPTLPPVAPVGKTRIYHDKTDNRLKFSVSGGDWQDVFRIERGGIAVNPNGITAAINIICWRAPYACTVTAVKGYRVGGSGATINARKNGSSNHLSSALSLTSADTWMDGGAVQNTSYAAGDKLEVMIVSATGSPTQLGVQVELVRS